MPRLPRLPLRLTLSLCLGLPWLGMDAGAQAAWAAAPTRAAPAGTVTVQAGDTAYSVARRAGVSVDTLLALNGLSSPALRVGQMLRVSAVTLHVVRPGETLYGLSRRYGLSVEALLAANTLPTDATLTVGQTLQIPGAAPGGTAAQTVNQTAAQTPVPMPIPTPAPAPSQPPASRSTPGAAPDTTAPAGVLRSPFLPATPVQQRPALSAPSRLPRPGAPELPGDLSRAGSAPLRVPTGAGASVSDSSAPLPTDWRSAALALLGTPYVYGGASRNGTDCSGLVLQVFAPLGIVLPRVSAEQAQAGEPVEAGSWLPGDLLFFDTLGQGQVSHVGIYLGDDSFVSANSFLGRVAVDRLLSDHYWSVRYLSARRVLSPLAAQP